MSASSSLSWSRCSQCYGGLPRGTLKSRKLLQSSILQVSAICCRPRGRKDVLVFESSHWIGKFNVLCQSSSSQNEVELQQREPCDGAENDKAPPVILTSWNQIPIRYKLILSTSVAFIICNMDKVNMSIAIIPISNQLHWNASTAGLVQSSFFWGYAVSQLPAGWLARQFTGEAVLGVGVLMWSVATAAVPMLSTMMPGLLCSRLVVGLGEGLSPSAATDIIARKVPIHERSRAVAFVFNGFNLGSIIGLVLAPIFIEHFGWESVFYSFGMLGVVWCAGFALTTDFVEQKQAQGKVELKEFSLSKKEEQSSSFNDGQEKVPWRAILRSPPVWAMIYTHFCGNWGHYCNLAWLPSYFRDELNLDLTNAALVSVLPPLGGMLMSGVAASMADFLISKDVDITVVRKLCQTIAFISPSVCMAVASLHTDLNPGTLVSLVTIGLSLSSFALAGLYCTHQDISPKYASILLGITNTAGAIPGILGVYLTGHLLDQTHSWTMALFAPCIFFWITGTIVWVTLASSKPQTFDQ